MEEFGYIAVGYVEEERLAYVVYRSELYNPSPEAQAEIEEALEAVTDDERQLMTETAAEDPQVMTARRQADGRWLLLASHMFLGQAGSFWFGYEPNEA